MALFGSPVFLKLPHEIEPTSVWNYAERSALEETRQGGTEPHGIFCGFH